MLEYFPAPRGPSRVSLHALWALLSTVRFVYDQSAIDKISVVFIILSVSQVLRSRLRKRAGFAGLMLAVTKDAEIISGNR